MQLRLKVTLGDANQEISLPVGAGTQSFKWLANAAAYRLVSDGARRGRFTPQGSGRLTLPAKTRLLPKNVYSDGCPFFHPGDVLKDHLEDGQSVNVDLYDQLELDAYGIPVLSPWATIAFRHDERHAEERSRLEAEKRFEVETFRKEREAQALIEKTNIERPKIRLMRKIMAPQLLSDDSIAATLSREWGLITKSGILDNIIPDKGQQEEVRSFIQTFFVELNDLYKFYSAVNSGGGTHTLEYIELMKFLTETGILGEEHSNTILRIFIDSHIGKSSKRGRPSIHSEIHRQEFFLALIKIAVHKNITLPKKELNKLRRAGQVHSPLVLHEVSLARANLPTAPSALSKLYQDFLQPVLVKMPAGSKMREAVGADSTMILLHDNLAQLAECFEKFSAVDDEAEGEGGTHSDPELSIIPGGSMDISKFQLFAGDAGFTDGEIVARKTEHSRRHSIMGNRSSTSVTQKDIRQIFSASQADSDEPNDIEQTRVAEDDAVSSHMEVMVFSEFLEAVARLGVLKHGHPAATVAQTETLSHFECIRLAVEQVCALVS